MKKKIIWLAALILSTTFFAGCFFDDDDGFFNCERGEGEIVVRTLDLPKFTGIDLDCSFNVNIRQGEQQSVTVEGHENIIDLLELDVQDEIWEIEFDQCVRDEDEDLRIDIVLPEIDFIRISGNGTVFGLNDINTNDLELQVAGSGDIDLSVFAKDISGKISGSGEISLEGTTETFTFITSGSGNWEAFDLEAERGEVRISGSGRTEVFVNEMLDVNITGSGNVYYRGNPQINVSITGSGKLINAN